MTVWLVVVITLLFAFGSFGLDATIYMMRRQQLQSLAESVAQVAAQHLPFRGTTTTGALGAALKWYGLLRTDNTGRAWAPAAGACTTTGSSIDCGAIVIVFLDNKTLSDASPNTVQYRVYGVNVTVKITYIFELFPILNRTIPNLTVSGKSTLQLAPTDVVLVIENSASMIDNTSATYPANWGTNFGTNAQKYANQCFSQSWRYFKQGVVELYDRLSQIETFRVGVVVMHGRAGSPFVMATLGEYSRSPVEYAFDQTDSPPDLPHEHLTRCASLTQSGYYPVPTNINSATWAPRVDISTLLLSPDGPNYTWLDMNADWFTRELIWVLNAGYSTENGFIPNRYYFNNPKSSVTIAANMLIASRRTDNLPVQNRVILVLTDDAGHVPSYTEVPEDLSTTPNTTDVCSWWATDATTPVPATARQTIKLGVVYFGSPNFGLYGHKYSDSVVGQPIYDLRANCLQRETSGATPAFQGIFMAENSFSYPIDYGEVNATSIEQDFYTHLTPLVAQSLKQTEYRK